MNELNINRVELSGVVGSVTSVECKGVAIVQFTLKTERTVMLKPSGEVVIESTWHSVHTTQIDADELNAGMKVYVKGFLRNDKYMGSDGVQRVVTVVIARECEIMDTEE